MNQEIEHAAHKLSLPRKVGFTLGDFASNIYWQSMSIFLLFYYTDAVGLSAAAAGLIFMVASIVDAMTDPLMGGIADRTRTRHGRYRPYILYGCVPLGFCFVLMFYKPPLDGLLLLLWLTTSHIIFRFAYTAVTIPYTSLNARLTDSSDERSTIAGLRMVFGVLAALTVSYFTYPLVAYFGGMRSSGGFAGAAVILAVIATLIYPFVFLVTREPEEPPGGVPVIAFRAYWKLLAGNRAFWVLMVAGCVAFVCAVALGKSVLYYFKYYLENEPASQYALMAMSASGLLIIPAWVLVTKYLGKRNAWFAAVNWGLACLGSFSLIEIVSPLWMTLWLIVTGASSLGLSMTFWSMLPDTVEYGEWVAGERTESFIFGLGQFFLKIALGIGAGLFGWLLDLAGYVPNVPQSASMLEGLKTIMILLPASGLVLAGVFMWFYPLRKGVHENIVRELALRRQPPIAEAQVVRWAYQVSDRR